MFRNRLLSVVFYTNLVLGQISFENNAYKNVVIKINSDVEENYQLIESIKVCLCLYLKII